MSKRIRPISEAERNINWEEVEHKIAIICNKFNNIESRYKDDLAQELRIHAFYISDDYYDLTRKAIDFWRTLQVRVIPEVPYFDLEILGGIKQDDTSVYFNEMVHKISDRLSSEGSDKIDPEIKNLASEIFEVILDDLIDREPKVQVREYKKYKPYHNQRISCSYLWEVMGEDVGSINYKKIRKAMKFLETVVKELALDGEIEIDAFYLQ